MNNRGQIALSEIMILIVGTFAIAWALGGGIGFVSGAENPSPVQSDSCTAAGGICKDNSKSEFTQTIEDLCPDVEGLNTICVCNAATPWADKDDGKCFECTTDSECPSAKKCVDRKCVEKEVVPPPAETGPAETCVDGKKGGVSCPSGKCTADGKGCEEKTSTNPADSCSYDDFKKTGKSNCAENFRCIEGNTCEETHYGTVAAVGGGIALVSGIAATAAPDDQKGLWTAITTSVGAGTGLTELIHGAGVADPYWLGGIGIVTTALAFAILYKEDTKRSVNYEGRVWQPPVDGKFCDECNKMGILPCSEYQCRSLGQACELVNPGSSDEACVWINPLDVNPPQLRPWDGALLANFKYEFDEGEMISPPDRGVEVKIINEDSTTGCIPAFEEFSFGLNASEPAQCKIDYVRSADFEGMEYFFGGSNLFKWQHKQTMRAAQLATEDGEGIDLENDQEYEMAVRCQDKNGNSNKAEIVFKFCVEAALDTTPPLVVFTDPANGLPFAYNQTSILVNVYTDEPADCSWSNIDQSYADMPNVFDCPSRNPQDFNAQMLYRCSGNVDNLKSRDDNEIFIRCKDQPNAVEEDRNANQNSHVLTLIGTQPLDIKDVSPEAGDVISDNTERIEVKLEAVTSAGYKDGLATCYYSDEGFDGPWAFFQNTVSHTHSNSELLDEGTYTYYIRCVDLGGNSVTTSTTFDVETDFESPVAVRVYHSGSQLKLITNEEAECRYGNKDEDKCDWAFDLGLRMRDVEGVEHVATWEADKTFYVKCKDGYGTLPTMQDECTTIVQPFETHL